MSKDVLAIFGAWVLVSLIAGTLIVTVRSWLKSRRLRSASQQAPVQIVPRRPAGRTREPKIVVGDKRRHARR
jgi:hypothetical protein